MLSLSKSGSNVIIAEADRFVVRQLPQSHRAEGDDLGLLMPILTFRLIYQRWGKTTVAEMGSGSAG